ncbi:PREDICTED: uncharacterized protein LOC106814515 isoform X2 [Priapulus caudatus]|uniref:Uncharacterized protein LOC106814515 isoform X2 n=1 Tax=Priapulus caudatus TaxID=37621 RepID=A0ABM1EQ43_PRICU|nr:PREDICTED: uncharacterized protein LOC106814515 isoform X2 [Priapulus caudatus]
MAAPGRSSVQHYRSYNDKNASLLHLETPWPMWIQKTVTSSASKLMLLSSASGQMLGSPMSLPDVTLANDPVLYERSNGAIHILLNAVSSDRKATLLGLSLRDLYRNAVNVSIPDTASLQVSVMASGDWNRVEPPDNMGLQVLYRSLGDAPTHMQTPILADLDRDLIADVLLLGYDGAVTVLGGQTFTELWKAEFPGAGSYSPPAVSWYNTDEYPDIMVNQMHGHNATVPSHEHGAPVAMVTADSFASTFVFMVHGRIGDNGTVLSVTSEAQLCSSHSTTVGLNVYAIDSSMGETALHLTEQLPRIYSIGMNKQDERKKSCTVLTPGEEPSVSIAHISSAVTKDVILQVALQADDGNGDSMLVLRKLSYEEALRRDSIVHL